MNLLAQKIYQYAKEKTDKIAIQGDTICLTYQCLVNEINQVTKHLDLLQSKHSFALLMDNHPAWLYLI